MKGNFFLPLLVTCLLLANLGTLGTLAIERSTFKENAIERQGAFEKQVKTELNHFVTEHLDPEKALHMPLDEKLNVFTPRVVSEERYKVIIERLTLIESALVELKKEAKAP